MDNWVGVTGEASPGPRCVVATSGFVTLFVSLLVRCCRVCPGVLTSTISVVLMYCVAM